MFPATPSVTTLATWHEDNADRSALWFPDAHGPAPARIVVADDSLSADAAYRLVSQGTWLLWRGDFQNGRQLLQALARRHDAKAVKKSRRTKDAALSTPLDQFNLHRLRQSQRSTLLNHLLIELDADAGIALRRAPQVQDACLAALGTLTQPFLLPLRALQGFIGAYEWQKKGVDIPALPARIHVPYGVFSPNRGEYIDLIAHAPLPHAKAAFDIGTGSGVLAALLAQRGVPHIVATDQDPRALACAQDNINRLGFNQQITLQHTDLFPTGRCGLIVCNPPWLPARPTTAIEHAIYDPDNRMLLGYLHGLAEHLDPDGEGWLIMSDLAEHLGLRSPAFLPQAISAAGLRVIEQHIAHPRHPKAVDITDPLHQARRAEVTSLWRLGHAR